MSSFLQYLPEIYQNDNSTIARYLSIFQNIYESQESEIENSHMLYDIETAPDEFVLKMAEWLAVEDMLLWESDKLRKVMQNIPQLYKTRGTISGLKLIIELYCGGTAYFVETYHAKRYNSISHLYPEYGGHSTLWVVLQADLHDGQRQTLEHLIKQNKPAHIETQLVVLKQGIVLGDYCYLGINSVVSEHTKAHMDGNSILGLGVLY